MIVSLGDLHGDRSGQPRDVILGRVTLEQLYVILKAEAKANLGGQDVAARLAEMTLASHAALNAKSELLDLKSSVPNKRYVAFKSPDLLSRPVNADLFVFDGAELEALLTYLTSAQLSHLKSSDVTRLLYTVSIAFSAANDLRRAGDKKTPATYFETVVGHVFARALGVNPVNSVEVLNLDMKGNLPTDFIFDLGSGKPKFHLPVKISTRERVIQVWAHQRVLDGIYGAGRFKGLLVVLTETKLDTKKLEVVEICLPDQWRVYQMFIAQLARIYYLDPPDKYATLSDGYPKIEVKPLGSFFGEAATL